MWQTIVHYIFKTIQFIIILGYKNILKYLEKKAFWSIHIGIEDVFLVDDSSLMIDKQKM